jgi:hypothetical protein
MRACPIRRIPDVRKALPYGVGAILPIVVLGLLVVGHFRHPGDAALTALTPWQCVGGCGAGGSGGVGSDVKWIGNGVSGGLIDAQVMGLTSIGQDYQYDELKTRLSIKPTWTSTLGLTIPIVSNTGNLQPATEDQDYTEVAGGLSDIMLDYSKTVGMEGEYSLMFNLTLPTGQYDIKRGRENQMQYLPTAMQCGGGIYNATIGIGKTIDVDKGLWIVEAFYAHPFEVNFYGMNQFMNSQPDQYNDLFTAWNQNLITDKSRFQYWFKPYGENDLGGFTPPSINADIYYGYRGIEHYVHSFGAKLWVPLGVDWIPAFAANTYDPIPDPDNRTWSLTLHYGLEFSKPEYPIYIAINKLIESGASSEGKFVWPDGRDFLDSWTLAIGIKTSMF